MNVKIKVEYGTATLALDEGYRVYTSRNGNGYWGVGIPFTTETAANIVADALESALCFDGAKVERVR